MCLELYTVLFWEHRYIDNFMFIEFGAEKIIYSVVDSHEYVDFLVGKEGVVD